MKKSDLINSITKFDGDVQMIIDGKKYNVIFTSNEDEPEDDYFEDPESDEELNKMIEEISEGLKPLAKGITIDLEVSKGTTITLLIRLASYYDCGWLDDSGDSGDRISFIFEDINVSGNSEISKLFNDCIQRYTSFFIDCFYDKYDEWCMAIMKVPEVKKFCKKVDQGLKKMVDTYDLGEYEDYILSEVSAKIGL